VKKDNKFTKTNISIVIQLLSIAMVLNPENDAYFAPVKSSNLPIKKRLRKRYNKLVVIDLEKRATLRNMIKQNTFCEHKQIYTQANAICRRMSSSYEEGKITLEQAAELMIEAHNEMSHRRLPKEIVNNQMNKLLDKLERGEKAAIQVSTTDINSSNITPDKENKSNSAASDEKLNKYSESYWSEVI
jgi:hypothetical protein